MKRRICCRDRACQCHQVLALAVTGHNKRKIGDITEAKVTGLRKIEAEMTGFANYGGEDFINANIEANPEESNLVIREMQKDYGQEQLEQMSSQEFYRLYKDYTLTR